MFHFLKTHVVSQCCLENDNERERRDTINDAPKKKYRTITREKRYFAEEGATIELQTEPTMKVKKRATLCEKDHVKFKKIKLLYY